MEQHVWDLRAPVNVCKLDPAAAGAAVTVAAAAVVAAAATVCVGVEPPIVTVIVAGRTQTSVKSLYRTDMTNRRTDGRTGSSIIGWRSEDVNYL